MRNNETNFSRLLAGIESQYQLRLSAVWANHRRFPKYGIYHDKILKGLEVLDKNNPEAVEAFVEECEKDYQFHSAYKANRRK
jgi:hypothetical protein